MLRYIFFILAGFVPLLPSSASDLKPYFSLRSFSHSEPTSIRALTQSWDDKFYGGDTALSYNRAEAGVSWNNWQLGMIYRNDYQYEFTNETAELKYLTENHLALASGRTYPLSITANNLAAKGVSLSHKRDFGDELAVRVAISYLEGISLTSGGIAGYATALSGNDYDFAFDVDYFYSQDVLFGRENSSPDGTGYAADVSLYWQPTQRIDLKLELIDLLGKMYWHDAPFTTATATSDTKQYDKDGYVIYRPAVSGLESNKDYIQHIPRKVFIDAKYKYSDNVAILAEYQDFRVKTFFSIGAAVKSSQNTELGVLFNFKDDAIKLQFEFKQLYIGLVTDKLNLKHARTFGLQVMLNVDLL